jgi:glycosyltransferase involved in cell wall biosynthesis
MKLSVVIPAQNEAASLPALLKNLRHVLGACAFSSEVIVVNDHSTDRTSEVIQEHGIRLVDNTARPGKGRALICGFEASLGDYIVMMDADGSHLPEFIPEFIRELDSGYGLIIGSRQLGGSDEYTFLRSLGNIFLSGIFNVLTNNHITDVLNGFKGFRRDIFTRFKYKSGEFEIEIELVANALKAGYRIGEFACHEKARSGGVAKSRIVRHGCRFLCTILTTTIPYRLSKTVRKDPAAGS